MYAVNGSPKECAFEAKEKSTNISPYPNEAIERLARAFYPAILACWNSVEGQREFAAWQAEQAHISGKEKQEVPVVVLPVCQQAGHCKRGFAAFKGVQNVRFPQLGSALFIQNFLAGKFIVLVNQIGLSGRVVRIFRGDMLQRCHTVYPELSRR